MAFFHSTKMNLSQRGAEQKTWADRRKFRWAHRGAGLCGGHKDGLFEVLIQPQMGIDSYFLRLHRFF